MSAELQKYYVRSEAIIDEPWALAPHDTMYFCSAVDPLLASLRKQLADLKSISALDTALITQQTQQIAEMKERIAGLEQSQDCAHDASVHLAIDRVFRGIPQPSPERER